MRASSSACRARAGCSSSRRRAGTRCGRRLVSPPPPDRGRTAVSAVPSLGPVPRNRRATWSRTSGRVLRPSRARDRASSPFARRAPPRRPEPQADQHPRMSTARWPPAPAPSKKPVLRSRLPSAPGGRTGRSRRPVGAASPAPTRRERVPDDGSLSPRPRGCPRREAGGRLPGEPHRVSCRGCERAPEEAVAAGSSASSISSVSSRSSIRSAFPDVLIASSYIVTSFGQLTTK